MQKIADKRQELRERAYIAKMNAKDKVKSGWMQLKDFILILYLLNTLIGLCQKVDIMEIMQSDKMVKTIVIDNSAARSDHVGQVSVAQASDTPDNLVEEKTGTFTAYNAEVAQTDADPFTMASGKRVYEGAIANNCLDFGTKIKVNGKIKVVEDRMKSGTECDHFDIFMNSYDEAIQFGKRELTYEIL
jgi:3D (Asp-Asp-Asp) domain-containing protein